MITSEEYKELVIKANKYDESQKVQPENAKAEEKIDTVEIKKEEIENAVLSSEIIVAIRIIFNKNKYRIDYLFFNDFFNIERDRWK